MHQLLKLGLFVLVTLFISGCFIARQKSNSDEKCELVTKKYSLELSEKLTKELEDNAFNSMWDDCEDIGCIIAGPFGAFFSIGVAGVVSGTVSGSVVVVGNTIHWIERQGKCEDSVTQKSFDSLSQKFRSAGGKVIDSSTDLIKWIKKKILSEKEVQTSSPVFFNV